VVSQEMQTHAGLPFAPHTSFSHFFSQSITKRELFLFLKNLGLLVENQLSLPLDHEGLLAIEAKRTLLHHCIY
jgi:hypothetical protein